MSSISNMQSSGHYVEHLMKSNMEDINYLLKNMPTLKAICRFLTQDGKVSNFEQFFAKYSLEPLKVLEAEVNRTFVTNNVLCYRINANSYFIVGSSIVVNHTDTSIIKKAKHELFWILTQANYANACNTFFTEDMVCYVKTIRKILNNKLDYFEFIRPERLFYDME